MKAIFLTIIFLALAGIVDSGYALDQHYSTAEASSCDINAVVSCTAVNQSRYSEIAGIPVAGIGMAGYALMGALAGLMFTGRGHRLLLHRSLVALSLIALAASLALTYIEVFGAGGSLPAVRDLAFARCLDRRACGPCCRDRKRKDQSALTSAAH